MSPHTTVPSLSWRSLDAHVVLELDRSGDAFIALRSTPTTHGDAAAGDLVCAAVTRAWTERFPRVTTTLDASRPVCGVVLTALRAQVGTAVRLLECRRSGASVLVSLDLLPYLPDDEDPPPPPHAREAPTATWDVRVRVSAAREVPAPGHAVTTAHAALVLDGTRFTGTGRSHRHPGDVEVPALGEDIAVARALGALSDRLLATALAQLPHDDGDPGAW
jgi:hypothetical protein